MDEIKALIELAEKATPGEWRAEEEDTDSGLNPDWFVQAICGGAWDNIAACGNDAWEDNWQYTKEQRKANAEFIAAARNSIPSLRSLLDQHRQMREWILKSYHPESCGAYGWAEDTDSAKLDCTCGLSALRSALEKSHG